MLKKKHKVHETLIEKRMEERIIVILIKRNYFKRIKYILKTMNMMNMSKKTPSA